MLHSLSWVILYYLLSKSDWKITYLGVMHQEKVQENNYPIMSTSLSVTSILCFSLLSCHFLEGARIEKIIKDKPGLHYIDFCNIWAYFFKTVKWNFDVRWNLNPDIIYFYTHSCYTGQIRMMSFAVMVF